MRPEHLLTYKTVFCVEWDSNQCQNTQYLQIEKSSILMRLMKVCCQCSLLQSDAVQLSGRAAPVRTLCAKAYEDQGQYLCNPYSLKLS